MESQLISEARATLHFVAAKLMHGLKSASEEERKMIVDDIDCLLMASRVILRMERVSPHSENPLPSV